ncbi:D-alanine--D-alanine ligase family protein [Mucilaginibacter pedocola]|uniref:ATP-grasp domain-containing protein n=1 Tax=Mucilaginibacter pedocola TaxID=1792845 RepID=A0A1S9PBU7_9SPHI|nr:hypothetical protein [Mucilaginibacter pedocola]OOQ58391.1 hypothetical protein BC343_30325 [Mucilaginibacter pedocola]
MPTLSLKDVRIVLVADRTYESYKKSDIKSNKLEMISDEYFNEVYSTLSLICKEVIHYQSPEELSHNVSKHIDDIVFTIYGGSDSRNRLALVPAICEACELKFVGADVYARIVCQDKFLAKEFAKRHHIRSAAGILVDNLVSMPNIETLKLPLIVKPNFEGSSIGISDSSKVYDFASAYKLVEALFKEFKQPVLVEEFISGKECVICIVGNNHDISMFEAMEIVFEGNENYLLDKVYSAKDKHLPDADSFHRPITHLLSSSEKENIKNLFLSLGKMDFMRMDGRLNNDGFFLIEMTPDCYIGDDCSFVDAIKLRGGNYQELLSTIINTALAHYHTPYSNYTGS